MVGVGALPIPPVGVYPWWRQTPPVPQRLWRGASWRPVGRLDSMRHASAPCRTARRVMGRVRSGPVSGPLGGCSRPENAREALYGPNVRTLPQATPIRETLKPCTPCLCGNTLYVVVLVSDTISGAGRDSGLSHCQLEACGLLCVGVSRLPYVVCCTMRHGAPDPLVRSLRCSIIHHPAAIQPAGSDCHYDCHSGSGLDFCHDGILSRGFMPE